MKAFKRIFASVMVTGMLATMSISSFASNIQPRGAICDNCGIGQIVTRVEHGDWSSGVLVPCIHQGADPTQKDRKRTRSVTYHYECTRCDYESEKSTTETMYEHVG